MVSTPNINDEMRQTAEYAIKIAKERFKKQLDYSEGSLHKLENVIRHAHQEFNANKAKGKTSKRNGTKPYRFRLGKLFW